MPPIFFQKRKGRLQHVQGFLEEVSGEPVLQARALWILAQIGGSQVVEKFLGNEDDQKLQVVAIVPFGMQIP